MLARVEVNNTAFQNVRSVAATKRSNFIYHLSGLLLRDKCGRLYRIDQYFQLRDAELPILNVIHSLPADLFAFDLKAIINELLHVGPNALTFTWDAFFIQLLAKLIGRKRMLYIGLLPQNLPKSQHLHFQNTIISHLSASCSMDIKIQNNFSIKKDKCP